MKKTRIIAMLLAILMVFVAVSCEEEPAVHSHVYGKEWKSDATNHWHECECGEKADVAEHTFEVVKDGEELVKKCTVCDYKAEEKIENAILVTTSDDFVSAVEDGSKTIYLGANLELASTVEISKNLEINLNGKKIEGKGTRVFLVKSDVEISGVGTITVEEGIDIDSSVIRVGFNSTEEKEVSLLIGKDVVVSSDYSYGVTVFGTKTKETLVVNGTIRTKVAPAVSGLGTDHEMTKITINGTVFTESDNAIYHPQVGELLINGTVEGKGGIEMKAGSLDLGENAVVRGGKFVKHDSINNNGCSTSGYAIAAVNNNNGYATGVVVNIEKGTIDGIIDIVDDVKPKNFKTGETAASISISGGTYTVQPDSKYVKEDYEVKKLSETSWTIVAK